MLSRRIARPLLATWFLAEGVDAVRRPAAHVERMRDAWRRLAARGDIPQPPSDEQLRTIVKVHGGATAASGLLLALGNAPRLAACSLAVLTLPLAVLDAPRKAGSVPADRRALARDLSLIGGAAIAALDREGRPGVGWRLQHAREQRAAERTNRP